MSQILFPDSPTPGDSIVAPNGVTYTYDEPFGPGVEGVWLAGATTPTTPLTITNPGAISGSPQVNATLTYTPGTATGGVGAISYSWQWFITPSTPIGPAGTQTTITVPAGALGQNIYVKLTATDSDTPTANIATADTANFPSSGTIAAAGITGAAAPSSIPGTASFTWNDGNQNLSATGCLEFSVNGGVSFTQASTAVSNGTTVITQWKDVAGSGTCGDAPQGTTITGTLTDGTLTSTFNFQINRIPNSFSLSPNTENTTPLTTTVNDPSFTLGGCNTAPLVWGVLTGGGTNPQFSIDGGTTWVNLPSVPTSGINVPVGVATIVRFTTSGSAGTETLDVYAGASTTAGEYQSSLFTVTVASAPFPNSVFTPAGAPNASPATVSTTTLHGTASCSNWLDGAVSLTSTGGIQFQVNGGGFVTSYPGPTANGDTIDVIWDPAAISTAADGAILNGTLTDGTFTNTYTITVTRGPVTGFSFTDTSGNALSTPTTSGIITPGGFNVPVTLTFAGTTSNPLNPVAVAVGTGGFLGSPQPVNPGQTLQIQGTTGPTVNTDYGVDLSMGSGPVATDTWLAKTTTGAPTITPPTIQTPSPGSTGQGSSTGITITANGYNNLNGAGSPQTSSDWEVYKGSYPLTSTLSITGVSQGATPWSSAANFPGWTTENAYAIGYGNGRWVAVGNNGVYSTSTNGTTWTSATLIPGWGSTAGPQTVAYGNGLWVAAGISSLLSTSTNGTTWTTATSLGWGAGVNVNSVAYGNGRWVAVGNGANYSTSTNGTTWTAAADIPGMPPSTSIRSVAYANGLWVTVAGSLYSTSTNGTTWTTAASIAGTPSLFSVAYGNGLWVAVGNNGVYSTSTNGTTWTAAANMPGWGTNRAISVAYGNGLWVAVGGISGGIYSVSSDGITWTTAAPLTGWGGINARSVAYGNGLWIASGDTTTYSTSANPAGTTTLAIAGCANDGFLIGDSVVSNPAAAGPATITAVSNTAVTVSPSSTSWAIGQQISRDTASYSQMAGSPFNKTTGTLTSLDIAKPPLEANTKYWVRARYATTNATATTSAYGVWSDFTTGPLLPAIGALYGGGYFAGQINDGGTIYNLVVAPVEGNTTGPVTGGALKGQNGGATPTTIQYKTSATADTPSATVDNQVYGGLTTDLFKASAAHPVFSTFINGATGPNAGAFNLVTGGAGGGTGIGGYNDWYLPARNELEILYYNLKPTTTSNNTLTGSNPDAVPPRASNYTSATPAQTTNALFQSGGPQDFSSVGYWCSSQVSFGTTRAWTQNFGNGNQFNGSGKNDTAIYARAVRRIAA